MMGRWLLKLLLLVVTVAVLLPELRVAVLYVTAKPSMQSTAPPPLARSGNVHNVMKTHLSQWLCQGGRGGTSSHIRRDKGDDIQRRIPVLPCSVVNATLRIDDGDGGDNDSLSRSCHSALSILRGGGGSVVGTVGNLVVSLLVTLLKNPLLLLLMMASSAIVLYKDQLQPLHAARWQGLVQFAMVCYVFRMLVAWQKRAMEPSDDN